MVEGSRKEVTTGSPETDDVMPDGSICAGTSPDTGRAMYTTPQDAPQTYTFGTAKKYAARLDASGRSDWRVPTASELNVLFARRNAIGGFDESGSNPVGWYWSSTQDTYVTAWVQRFSDGYQDYHYKNYVSSVRCVR